MTLHFKTCIPKIFIVARSPVFSTLNETLQGIQTIRAMGIQNKFVKEFDRCQDVHTSAWFLILALQRWMAVRLDMICAAFVTIVAFACVFAANSKCPNTLAKTVTFFF